MSISSIGSHSAFFRQHVEFSDLKKKDRADLSKGTDFDAGEKDSDKVKYTHSKEPSERELERKAQLEFLRKYIVSYGAPEELERPRIVDPTHEGEDEEDRLKRLRQGFNPNALETLTQAIEDPEEEGKLNVVVSKVDEKGQAKITRTMSFGGKELDGRERNEWGDDSRQSLTNDKTASRVNNYGKNSEKEEESEELSISYTV